MDILVTYKPFGIKTHRSSHEDTAGGFLEWLEDHRKERLFLFQRLDAGTSGLLLIAKTEQAAAQWTEKLKNHSLHKTYLFITKGPSPTQTHFKVKSLITKQKGLWISQNSPEPNSETHFTWVQSHASFHLWRAEPQTGKAHQIRLHAQSLGLSILGDLTHGGAPFFRMCLHALQLQDPELQKIWVAPAPSYFAHLNLLDQPELCGLLEACHQREQMIQKGYLIDETFRLSHQECPNLRIDCLGDQLWVYDYRNTSPLTTQTTRLISKGCSEWQNPKQKAVGLTLLHPSPSSPFSSPSLSPSTVDLLESLFQYYPSKPAWIREMKNRGQQPNQSQLTPFKEPKTHWNIRENGVHYEMRADQGLSPGLFLDQRENRLWVKGQSAHKNVLNLFSYTCGFSVCAALGGASTVVSVDVSQSFLEWGKTNFQLNQLNPHSYEFWGADSLEFLKRTVKRKRDFDLVICDPPSFGRSKKGVFNIEKDLPHLVSLIFQVLNPGGILLLSSNYEKWDEVQWKKKAFQNLSPQDFSFLPSPKAGLDFIEPTSPILKTSLIMKK